MLNMLEGHGKTWLIYTNTQDTADYYSAKVVEWRKIWKALCKTSLTGFPEALRVHVEHFRSDYFDEVAFQFILCEGSKVANFMITGHSRYLRLHQYDAVNVADEGEGMDAGVMGELGSGSEDEKSQAAVIGGA
jgi:hypothetical protein